MQLQPPSRPLRSPLPLPVQQHTHSTGRVVVVALLPVRGGASPCHPLHRQLPRARATTGLGRQHRRTRMVTMTAQAASHPTRTASSTTAATGAMLVPLRRHGEVASILAVPRSPHSTATRQQRVPQPQWRSDPAAVTPALLRVPTRLQRCIRRRHRPLSTQATSHPWTWTSCTRATPLHSTAPSHTLLSELVVLRVGVRCHVQQC